LRTLHVVVRVVRLLIAYDGTGFRGWARQRDPSVRTIEGALAGVLASVLGEEPRLAVAGRTDAGVHALGQVASFRTGSSVEPEKIQAAVNGVLGPELVVLEAGYVPDRFDARFSASARAYRYVVNTGPVSDPFRAPFEWFRPGELSVPRIRAAARHLVGEHDFTSFCRHPGRGRPTTRRLERLSVARDGHRVVFGLRANAFLHQMVRSIVGTLIEVGDGRFGPDAVARMLAARDRSVTGRVAPPHGLTLVRVVYGRRTHP
jgi:tRNA pseudouridine38-40 synthase